jgi:hypothetical protein
MKLINLDSATYVSNCMLQFSTKGYTHPWLILAREDVHRVEEEIDNYSMSRVSSELHEEPAQN